MCELVRERTASTRKRKEEGAEKENKKNIFCVGFGRQILGRHI